MAKKPNAFWSFRPTIYYILGIQKCHITKFMQHHGKVIDMYMYTYQWVELLHIDL